MDHSSKGMKHVQRSGKLRNVNGQGISFGPINDLEKHLEPDLWKRIFNSMYLKTDGDVVDDLLITGQEVDLFCDILQMQPEQAMLDLACGQGRHALELSRRGFKNVHGLDRSHYLIQKAKAANQKEKLSVSFRE